jgi:signal transduction histidine kinase
VSSSTTPPRPLLHAIAIRLATVAAGLIAVMVVVTILEYTGNVEKLRRATLEEQAEHVFDSLRSGRTADFMEYCERYPSAYGYRIFDDKNEILTEVNRELFPEMPRYRSGRPDLSFKHQRTSDPWTDQWFLTRGGDVKGRPLWIHVTMIGDPAGLWREVVLEEVVEHVVVPAILIVPALSLAIFLALRSALRPLNGIAERARGLALEANSGTSLQELRSEGLPREALDLVGAINALLRKSESMLEQQKQFTANAAHELRTPLAVLLLQISYLPASETVDRLKSDVAVMSRMVDQLLRLAQAEQLAKAGFSSSDLRDIARAACEEMAVLATSQGRLIEFDEPPTPVAVSCNPEFVQIAIRNIIENGLRAAPVGSTVSIAVDSHAYVTVSDRGPGIPDPDKKDIFQRFWSGCRRSGEGAGIGLALVRRIMDLHAGEAHVEDREGGGACVRLSLRPSRPRYSHQLRRPSSFCGQIRLDANLVIQSRIAALSTGTPDERQDRDGDQRGCAERGERGVRAESSNHPSRQDTS